MYRQTRDVPVSDSKDGIPVGFTSFTSSTSPVTGFLIGLGRSSRYPGTATQLSRPLISPSKFPYMGSKKVSVILAKI